MRSRQLFLLLLASATCGGQPEPAGPLSGYLIYVRDREGSVLAAVDDRGTTVSTTSDDAFGLRLSSTGTPVPREFLDQDRDDETGYYHFRRRYYDPATAQWISPDPKLVENPDCSARVQACNPYAFAGNRPTEWTDPDGREVVAYLDAFGRQTLVISAGFFGADAARGQQLFNEAMLRFQGELHVIAYTAVYASEREIPDGITRIQADLSTRRPDGYLGSSTLTDQSRAILGADALDPAGNARWGSVIQHETLHLAGLDESYVQSGDLSVNSPASQKGSVMGLLYDVPESHLTAKDLTDIAHPPIEPNQGMRSSPPGFGSGQNVQVYDNYLP